MDCRKSQVAWSVGEARPRPSTDQLFRAIVGTPTLLGALFIAPYLHWGSGPILLEVTPLVPIAYSVVGSLLFIGWSSGGATADCRPWQPTCPTSSGTSTAISAIPVSGPIAC
jgi:hypothetical protein